MAEHFINKGKKKMKSGRERFREGYLKELHLCSNNRMSSLGGKIFYLNNINSNTKIFIKFLILIFTSMKFQKQTE